MTHSSARARIRDVLPKLYLGRYQPGPLNSLTDVAGVLVSTQTIHEPKSKHHGPVNTGVTTIIPRKEWFSNACHAGIFRFNGAGEMTGSHWIEETGRLNSPIMLTTTVAVGPCLTGIWQYAMKHYCAPDGTVDWFILPVVSETFDGFLNDSRVPCITPELAIKGIEDANAGPVAEGNTGGGTGMMSLGHKAGTGSASRLIPGLRLDSQGKEQSCDFTIAALVQSNFGGLHFLRIGGVPVGRLCEERDASENDVDKAKAKKDGSIVVIIATDAPLQPLQLQRVAKRAASGVSRVGGWASNQSGDLFLAFSTAQDILQDKDHKWTPRVAPSVGVIDEMSIDAILEASTDIVEEAIYNALCMAETTEGSRGTAKELDLDWLKDVMERYL